MEIPIAGSMNSSTNDTDEGKLGLGARDSIRLEQRSYTAGHFFHGVLGNGLYSLPVGVLDGGFDSMTQSRCTRISIFGSLFEAT
jgi:hypothetical protein